MKTVRVRVTRGHVLGAGRYAEVGQLLDLPEGVAIERIGTGACEPAPAEPATAPQVAAAAPPAPAAPVVPADSPAAGSGPEAPTTPAAPVPEAQPPAAAPTTSPAPAAAPKSTRGRS